MTLFENPLFLGFEQFERTLTRIAKSSGGGYPPYNIEQIGDSQLRITVAVAGFDAQDLDVTVEDKQLAIRGRQAKEAEDASRRFLHRGIAARQFQRFFVLAEDIEIQGASLDAGLLHVDLVRCIMESEVQRINIDVPENSEKKIYAAEKKSEK